MAEKPEILVVGSINMDLVVRGPHMPAPGETVLGDGFGTYPGGKGANQAVAAARLGGKCRMIGRVGRDGFGDALLANMKAEGIDCSHIMPTDDAPTGVAMIIVDSQGENSIVVASGANYRLTPDDIFPRAEAFEQARVLVLQLELPLPTVRVAIDLARRRNCKVILDPAPAPRRLPDALYKVDVFSPNAGEAEMLTGISVRNEADAHKAAQALRDKGVTTVIITLGAAGAYVLGNEFQGLVPGFKVDAVDTTAAGDTFNGTLALALVEGMPLAEAVAFANAAAALSVTMLGAQPSAPQRKTIEQFLKKNKR